MRYINSRFTYFYLITYLGAYAHKICKIINSTDHAWDLRLEDTAQLILHQVVELSPAVLSGPVHRPVDPEPLCRPRPV